MRPSEVVAWFFGHYDNILPTYRSAMSLQAFSLPLPQTRYFRTDDLIYKFKIRGGTSFRGEKTSGEDSKNQELEEMIRTVLGNLERLQPFSSAHYTAFPYRKRRARKCKHAGKRLRFYPFTLLLYLEKNLHCGEQIEKDTAVISDPSKRRWRNAPLEGAIPNDFMKYSEPNSTNQHAEPEEAPPAFDEPERTEDTEGGGEPPASSGLLRRLLRHIWFFFRTDGGQT